ncbi:MAG: thioredoxin-like domain-containing protein [Bacteroidota bacterium]
MKKRHLIFIWLIVLTLAGCDRPQKAEISGIITNARDRMIYLEELMVASMRPVDSVKIGKNGEFRFRHHVSIPTFFLLKLSENNFVTLLIDSAEVITVKADALNFAREYLVEGSPGSILVQELNQKLNTTKQRLDSLSSLYSLYLDRADFAVVKEQLDKSYQEIVEEQINYSTTFVSENPFSMASVLALYQKFDNENYVVRDLQALRIAASALNSFYPQSEHVKALYQNTLQLIAMERNEQLRRLVDEAGSSSPEIVLPDQNGNEIALSSLRGKYVLLHFWSALDQNSRILNPVLVEAYQKYRSRGFEIYQVSVDKDRQPWLNAIRNDKLTWTNVGDMNGSIQAVMLYNIQSVPFNYLLDREGNIVARNLAGPALDKTLSSLLK